MIEIAHESPLSIMGEVRESTDYCYALVHLFKEYPEYYKFFKDSLKMGRRVILDNSIFELGESFNSESFAYWIRQLKPTEYIVPDVLEDSEKTIENLYFWLNNWKDSVFGKSIGVVQGKTYEELRRCYQSIDEHCDKIAISFNYSYYEKLYPHKNKLISWMNGRVLLINQLLQDGFLNTEKPHHLLGIALPQEALFYRGYDFIETWDTSNPVVHTILGKSYEDWGCLEKPSIKMVDLLHTPSEKINRVMLKYNIEKFKSFLK